MARRIDPARRRLPPQDWPARDRAAWEAALRSCEPFGCGGLASQWRFMSQKKVSQAHGRWINFLRERGWLRDDEGPAERASRDRLRAYHVHLLAQGLAPVTIAGLFADLREGLRVMWPGADLAVLERAVAVLQANARPARDKTRTYVRPAELLRVAQAHLEAAALDASRHRPARIRTALQLLFLIMRPIRRENFIRLRLGHDIVRSGAGSWSLRLSAEVTKNHRPFEATLPQLLGHWLDRYLAEWRPVLLDGSTSGRLWITNMDQEMTGDGLYGALAKLTQKLFGTTINPHAFRDGPATALAIEDPAHVGGKPDPRPSQLADGGKALQPGAVAGGGGALAGFSVAAASHVGTRERAALAEALSLISRASFGGWATCTDFPSAATGGDGAAILPGCSLRTSGR